MFRFATLSLLAAASLSSALSIPRSASVLEERNLLNLDLNANVLQPGHGLLDTDLTASVLKNGKTGSSLVDLDSKVGVLTGNRHGSNLLDVDADATVGKNGKTGSSLLDADVDATVGHVSKTGSSLLDATVNADVLKNGKTGKSLLGADVDATVLSTKKGLLDATATVTSGAASVAGLSVLSGKSALIDVDVLGTILGPQQCTGNAVIGVQAELTVGNLLHVCACVEILSLGSNQKACPTCPANADPLCGSGQCGCKCRDGFFASVSHGCLPIHTCTSSGGRLSRHSDGTSSCECSSPYVSNNEGRCHLPASARARRSRKATLMTREGDAAKCPNGERACPTGSNGGYECLDVMNSLESCGGCPGEKSAVNCQTIAGAKSASCSAGVCEISSCFPGFLYKNGRCVRSKRA